MSKTYDLLWKKVEYEGKAQWDWAGIFYTVADALEQGHVYPLAVVSATYQERYLLESINIPENDVKDITM